MKNVQSKSIKAAVCAMIGVKIVTFRGLLKGIRELVREGSNNFKFDYLTQNSKAYTVENYKRTYIQKVQVLLQYMHCKKRFSRHQQGCHKTRPGRE